MKRNGWEIAAYVVHKTPAGESYTVTERLADDDNDDPITETVGSATVKP